MRLVRKVSRCFALSSAFTYLLIVFLYPVSSKMDSAEIFGPYNSRRLYQAHEDQTLFSTTSSPPLNSHLIVPTNASKQSDDLPLTTEIAVSHPIVGHSQARIPLYMYNPGLARKLGLSTLLMTSVIYGLTILPALLSVTGNNPLGGLFSSLTGKKRKKRSLWLRNLWELPLMDKDATQKFLTLLETTMEVRKVNSTICKQHNLCKVYQKALTNEEYEDEPLTLSRFEKAIVKLFGIAAERKGFSIKVPTTVKTYYEPALLAITGSNCSKIFPCFEDIKYRQYAALYDQNVGVKLLEDQNKRINCQICLNCSPQFLMIKQSFADKIQVLSTLPLLKNS